MREIVGTGTILASAPYYGDGLSHPTGAYATEIPPAIADLVGCVRRR
ncbi:MAG: hypothetical protein O9324_14950 [Microcystis sp. LE19-84.1B]|nr:hypothetical protein [Microcystis sp. LE19-84.1B]MCZ8225205.1 hypothetical protein [Microcystis sp. LE19-84.1B]NCS29855.1 hypothetical protein [Microcystis aeruginosa F13-15]